MTSPPEDGTATPTSSSVWPSDSSPVTPTQPAKAPVQYLTLEDALTLIDDLGVGPIRDIGLLDSALHRHGVAPFGVDAYPSLEEKAAVLLESIVRNHPLVDGNKRLGWLSTVVFLGLNGIELDALDDAAYNVVIGLAAGSIDHTRAAATLRDWI